MSRLHVPLSLLLLSVPVACGKTDPAAAEKAKAVGGAAGALIQKAEVEAKMETDAKVESVRIVSPRDTASGLPTGKRQHKPVVVTKPVDKAAPIADAPTEIAAPQ